MLWIAGVHLVGLACVVVLMFPAMKDAPSTPKPDRDGDGDDGGWGRGPKLPPPPPGSPQGGIPLPDAVQSDVRLREPGRISERRPQRVRRPAREPERQPVPTPHR
jgi:hypothetical protein